MKLREFLNNESIMDSGYTFHITPRSDLFVNIRHIKGGKVLIGNDKSCNVTGISSVKFKMLVGSIKILDNVRFLPKLRRNLISLGLLYSNGYFFKSENGVLKILKGSLVVMKGKLVRGLYILDGIVVV